MRKEDLPLYRVDRTTIEYRVLINGQWRYFGLPNLAVAGIEWNSFGRFTGMWDSQKKKIYEGDIIECDAKTPFGSMIKVLGIMVYDDVQGSFIVDMPTDDLEKTAFEVTNVRVVGSISTTPELLCPPKPQNNQ